MHPLGEKQQLLLADYANFIRGQNSKKVHSVLRIAGALTVLMGLVTASPFWVLLGLGVAAISLLGNQQLKHIESAVCAANKPHAIKDISLFIDTELWDNNTNYFALVDMSPIARYKIYFIPLGKVPEKGNQLGKGYYLENVAHPALISLDTSLIIPNKTPKTIK